MCSMAARAGHAVSKFGRAVNKKISRKDRRKTTTSRDLRGRRQSDRISE